MGVNAFDIKLLNGSAQEISYYGVETVTFPEASGSGVVKFTAGEPLDSSFVQIAPDFTSGDMLVDAPPGYVVRDALILKPSGMEAVIAKGASLMGVDGSYVTPGTSKSVTLDFASGSMSISAVGDERWAQIDIAQPATLLPENIKKNVTVAGIVGSYVTPGTTKAVTLDFSGGDMSIAAVGDERWNEIDIAKPSTLIPGNIADGVEVAGIIGTRKAITVGSLMNKTLQELDDDAITVVPSSYFMSFYDLQTVSLANCSIVYQSGFYNCSSISTVSLPSATIIHPYAFYSCKNLASIYAPQLSSIANNAFASTGLVSVNFPSCKTIQNSAFCLCSSMVYGNFPACESIGLGAFAGTHAELYFGSNISYVGTSAFGANSTLTSIYLGNCSSVGAFAFSGAMSVSIDFGDSSHAIGLGSQFVSISNIYVESQSNNYYYGDVWLSGNQYTSTVRDGTKYIPGYVFSYNWNMNYSITLPSTIVCISPYAFYSRGGLKFARHEFPELRSIGDFAYAGVGYQGSFSIIAPKLSYVGLTAFGGSGYVSSRLTSVSMSKFVTVQMSAFRSAHKTRFLNSAITLISCGTYAFFQCSSMQTAIRFLNNRVPSSAFTYCFSLSTVVLQNVSWIDPSAFYGCSRLNSLYICERIPYLENATVFGACGLSVSTTLGHFGSIYVAESLYASLITRSPWSLYSARMVSITDEDMAVVLSIFEEET